MRRYYSMRWCLVFPLVVTLLFSGLHIDTGSINATAGSPLIPPGLTSHSPIDIDGEINLISTATAEGWSGSGAENDPFIIEDLYIDAEGTSHCLEINDTTSHVLIRNCTFTNATGLSSGGWAAGLWLNRTSNIEVVNVNVDNCMKGVCIDTSDHIDLLTVSTGWNSVWGIESRYSGNISLSDSRIHNNSKYGMESKGDKDLVIEDCSIENNIDPFVSTLSEDHLISHTNFFMNRGDFEVVHGRNISIINSRFYYFSGSFLIDECQYITVRNNTLDALNNFGFVITWSSDISVENNDATAIRPLTIQQSMNAVVRDNQLETVSSAYGYGIYLSDLVNGFMSNNTVTDANVGLYLTDCEFIEISDITFLGVIGRGFHVTGSIDIMIDDVSPGITLGIMFTVESSYGVRISNISSYVSSTFCEITRSTDISATHLYAISEYIGFYIYSSSWINISSSTVMSHGTAIHAVTFHHLNIDDCWLDSQIGSGLILYGLSYGSSFTQLHITSDQTSSLVIGSSVIESIFENILLYGYGIRIHFDYYNDYEIIPCLYSNYYRWITLNNREVIVMDNANLGGSKLNGDPGQVILYNVTDADLEGLSLGNASIPLSLYNCNGINIENTTVSNFYTFGIGAFNSRNLLIKNLNSTNSAGTGIHLMDCENITIDSCDLLELTTGIYVEDSSLVTVDDCDFVNTGTSINIRPGSSVLSRNNYFSGWNNRGIYVYYSALKVLNNSFNFNSKGIQHHGTESLIVRDTTFNNINGQGIYFTSSPPSSYILDCSFIDCRTGIEIRSSTALEISRCEFISCGTGIFAGYGKNGLINHSVFIENDRGIEYNGQEESLIKDCLFFDNSFGAIDMYSSEDNMIFGNAFIGNGGVSDNFNEENTQCSDDGTDNIWYGPGLHLGNHWSELTEPDEDLDGIVDISYLIMNGDSIDPLPLVFSPFPLILPPRNLSATVGANGVDLKWAPPPSNYYGYLIGYNVYRGTVPSRLELISRIDEKNMIFLDRGLTTGETYYYQVRAVTNLGAGYPTSILTATTDGSPPVIRITDPQHDSYLRKTGFYVNWTAYDHETEITGFNISVDKGTMIDVGLNLNYYLSGLTEGKHTFRIEARNGNGMTSYEVLVFTVDITPPDLRWTQEEDWYYYRSDRITLSFDGSDVISEIDGYTYRIDHDNWLYGGRTEQISVTLSEGDHLIEVRAEDLAGNYRVITANVTIDTSRPTVQVISPLPDQTFNDGNITIRLNITDRGTGIDLIEYSVDGDEWISVDVGGLFQIKDLENGRHDIRIRVEDRVGNHDETSVSIYIDITDPYVRSYGPTGSGNKLKPNIFITFSELMDQDSLQIEFDGTGIGVWDGNEYVFSVTKDLIPGETYEVFITCKDLAGNSPSEARWSFETTDLGYIRGKVVSDMGYPISGAEIIIAGTPYAFTDSEGFFFIEVSMGDVLLEIKATGMEDKEVTIRVIPDQEVGPVLIEMEEKAENSSTLDLIPIIIVGVGVLMILILIVGLVIAKRMGKDDFEFFIEQDSPQTSGPEYATMKSEGDFDDFWLDTGDDILSDHYMVLGIPRSSSDVEIKKAYRKMAARYHPDRAHLLDDQGRIENEEMMAHINEAKTVLLNPKHRMLYDAWLYDHEQ